MLPGIVCFQNWLIDSMGFKQRLRDGYEYQRAVAHDLLDLGWTVRLPPLQVRPTFADRADYSDDGDIWVQRPGSDAWEAVEVKSRNLDFTGVGDYPYD